MERQNQHARSLSPLLQKNNSVESAHAPKQWSLRIRKKSRQKWTVIVTATSFVISHDSIPNELQQVIDLRYPEMRNEEGRIAGCRRSVRRGCWFWRFGWGMGPNKLEGHAPPKIYGVPRNDRYEPIHSALWQLFKFIVQTNAGKNLDDSEEFCKSYDPLIKCFLDLMANVRLAFMRL